jgi:beta-galactosidase
VRKSIVLLFVIASLARVVVRRGGLVPAKDMMTVGVYYYPEAWPKEQWPRDIREHEGVRVRVRAHGEFAWAFMEPEEGRFEFAWLERSVRLAAAQGLRSSCARPRPLRPPGWCGATPKC